MKNCLIINFYFSCRSPIDHQRSKCNSYLKFHEDRLKLNQKEEKKIDSHQGNEKYRKLPKTEVNSPNFHSEGNINSPNINCDELNDKNLEKLNYRKTDKYSERPVIQVDVIPAWKTSANNSKSKIKLAQFILNRKLNQKQPKINENSEENVIGKQKNCKNDGKIVVEVKNNLSLKKKLKNNYEKEEMIIVGEIEREEGEDEKNAEKYLAKGDNNFFRKNVPSQLPKVEGLYHGDSLKSKFSHLVPNCDDESMNCAQEKETINNFNYEENSSKEVVEKKITTQNKNNISDEKKNLENKSQKDEISQNFNDEKKSQIREEIIFKNYFIDRKKAQEEEIVTKNYCNDEKNFLSQVEEEDEEDIEKESTDSSSEENSECFDQITLDSRRKYRNKLKSSKRMKFLRKKKSLQKLQLPQEAKSLENYSLSTEERREKKKNLRENILSQAKMSSEEISFLQRGKSVGEKLSLEEKISFEENKLSSDEKIISLEEKKVSSDKKKLLLDRKRVLSKEAEILFEEREIISEEKKSPQIYLWEKMSSSDVKLNLPEKRNSPRKIFAEEGKILHNGNSSEMRNLKTSCQSIGMQTSITSLTDVPRGKIQIESIG